MGRLRPGVLGALLVFLVYGAVSLWIDVPGTTIGFHSDEATYYLIGHSVAHDFDLEYRREDLVRALQEYPEGPSGVFLKKGQTRDGRPDPDPQRLYYGKAFVYPLLASPFVKVFGTNGFFLFNSLLMAGAMLAAYAFFSARAPATPSLLLSGAFILATTVPAYAFWVAPEVFNFACGAFAYFCWLYKEVAPAGRSRWLRDGRSDYGAAALLGMLTFSKVTNAAMFIPVLLWLLWKRQWKRAGIATGVFVLVAAAFFGVNVATSGDWNYQGGLIEGKITRFTFHSKPHGQPAFPFQTSDFQFDPGLQAVARNDSLWDVIFDPDVFVSRTSWNTLYTFVGRHAGIVPYFFPAAMAMAAFLWRPRARPLWQWLVLLGGLMQIFGIMISQPYTWNGSGGSLGNRYFITAYGLFPFLLPPIRSVAAALVPWLAGALFTAKIVLHPFYYSYNPDEPTWHGPLRWLPIERTLVNDLPMNTDIRRVRILFGPEDFRFQLYYLDENAFFREPDDAFWVRGDSRADFIAKAAEPLRTLQVGLQAGPVPVRGSVRLGWRRHEYSLQPGETATVSLDAGGGFPYEDETWVLTFSVSVDGGFLPSQVEAGSTDTRFLGVRVKPVMVR